jgi:hypothetical protein
MSGTESILHCAHCNEEYLHRTETRHYLRDREGSETGTLVVTLPDGSYSRDGALMVGNPSDYRNGLTIEFVCEQCGNRSALDIAQHKGCTYITMRALEEGDWGRCD